MAGGSSKAAVAASLWLVASVLAGGFSCEAASGLRQPVFGRLFQEASCQLYAECGLFSDEETCFANTSNFVPDEEVPGCPCYDAVAARECVDALLAGEGSCSPDSVEVTYPDSCYRVCCQETCASSECDIAGRLGTDRCEALYPTLNGDLKELRDELLAENDIGEECYQVPLAPTRHPDGGADDELPAADVTIEALYFTRASGVANADPLVCGAKFDGVTLCVGSENPQEEVYVVLYETTDPMPFNDRELLYEIGFAFDQDSDRANNYLPPPELASDFFENTDRWYVSNYSPATGWRIDTYSAEGGEVLSVPSQARFLIRDRAVGIVIPASELVSPDPAVRVSIFRHDGGRGTVGMSEWTGDVFPPQESALVNRRLRRPF